MFKFLRAILGLGTGIEIHDASEKAVREFISRRFGISVAELRDSMIVDEHVKDRMTFQAECCMYFGKALCSDQDTTVGELVAQLTGK